MKIKRILSGLILVAILAIILILGNTTVVNISISIIAMISINEYFNSFKGKYNVDKWVGNIMAILLAFIGILPKEALILIFPISIVILFTKVVVTRNENKLRRHCYNRFWNNIYYWIYFVHTIDLFFRKWKNFNMVSSNSSMGNRYICIFYRNKIWKT